MRNVIVIAPHPDDETLGCGGSILKHINQGDNVSWIIITQPKENKEFNKSFLIKRKKEIRNVKKKYNLKKYFELNFETKKIRGNDIADLVNKISRLFSDLKPNIVFAPYHNDVHTDHQIISIALQSNIKWFRHQYIEEVLLYETLSETNFNRIYSQMFKPNTYYDISKYLNKKISIMKIYKSEFQNHPFPRSELSIKSLAYLRGSECGYIAAEAFELIYQKK